MMMVPPVMMMVPMVMMVEARSYVNVGNDVMMVMAAMMMMMMSPMMMVVVMLHLQWAVNCGDRRRRKRRGLAR